MTASLHIPDAEGKPLLRRERRLTSLRAYATRGDGTIVAMTLTDLSYEGCGVECATALQEEERLHVAVARRGTIEALVRWWKDGRAGLAFPPPQQVQAPVQKPRRHQRVSVGAEVAMRRAGKLHFRVRVYDLSPAGCKAEFVERPELNEQLWIKFDGMEAIEAQVRWIAGRNVGLMFARPIYQAVFDGLAARFAAEAPVQH